MSRRRAWILAAIASASLVALVIGVGASTGQFGFGGSQRSVEAEGASPTSTEDPSLSESFLADPPQQSDGREGDDSESHNDSDEHERDDDDDDDDDHDDHDDGDDHEGDFDDSEDED